MAGATVVLLIFLLVQFYSFYSLSADKLYSEKYEAYDVPKTTDTSESGIKKAFREKKYKDILKLNANSVLTVNDIFLTGIAFLETKDFSKAISSFQVVLAEAKKQRLPLKDTAEYYLALAYLKNNDYDQAIELMSAVHEDTSHRYNETFTSRYIGKVKRMKWR